MARKNPRPGYENDWPVHWLMMNNELFPLCFPLMPTIGTFWLSYTADIKYRPNNPDVSGASNYLLQMKYIEYACKASWSMITTGHVEITFFFFFISRLPMLIFNVVFSMFIFNVDFRCWFSMLFLTMIFTVYFLLLFFRSYFFHNIVSAEIIFLYFLFFTF